MKHYFLGSLIFWSFTILAQTTKITAPVMPKNLYLIRNPAEQYDQWCGKCSTIMREMPEEETVSIIYVKDDKCLYLYVTSEASFNKLFINPFDGVSADIILKDRYKCETPVEYSNSSWLCKGYLTPPTFTPDLKKKKQLSDGSVLVNLGPMPEYFRDKEFEINTVIFYNRTKCYTQTFYNLETHKWNLLEMGMYLDTLTEDNIYERSSYLNRLVKFEIPFKKDKSEYLAKDIKPLYDSLKLSNYIIHSLKIHAYSSIEGSTERNMELQQKRSESIVRALQSLQGLNFDGLKKEITTAENWIDFYGDIVDGRFSYLNDLNKEQIKEKLNADKKLAADMESMLSRHRKAVIILEVEAKSPYENADADKIQQLYEQSLASNNVKEALRIQKEIFMRIRSNRLPDEFLSTLEVPTGQEFGLLRNSKLGFQFQEDNIDVFTAYKQYKKLADLMPDNHRVRYNLVALQLRGWLTSELIVDPEQLKKDIEALEKMPIDKRLIKRLRINYSLINSERLMSERKYEEKNQALKVIYDYYAFLKLSESDLVSLAQYFSAYNKTDWARKILYPYAKKIDVGEELLFYYINLTITNDETVSANQYKPILLNAKDTNRDRFCRLFNTSGKDGGVTFQLLDNESLQQFYCETCTK